MPWFNHLNNSMDTTGSLSPTDPHETFIIHDRTVWEHSRHEEGTRNEPQPLRRSINRHEESTLPLSTSSLITSDGDLATVHLGSNIPLDLSKSNNCQGKSHSRNEDELNQSNSTSTDANTSDDSNQFYFDATSSPPPVPASAPAMQSSSSFNLNSREERQQQCLDTVGQLNKLLLDLDALNDERNSFYAVRRTSSLPNLEKSSTTAPTRLNSSLSNQPTHDVKRLRPGHFFIYSELEWQASFSHVVFFLQSNNESYVKIPPVGEFAIRVLNPSGEVCTNVKIQEDPMSSSRIMCSFFAPGQGIYTAEVRLRVSGHVGGSPMKITVCRNFTSNDVRVYKGKGNDTCKLAWGLAYNPTTDEVYVAIGWTDYGEISVRTLRGRNCRSLIGGSKLYGEGETGCDRSQRITQLSGVAYDSTWDRIILVDGGNHLVCFFTPQGKFIGSFGHKGNGNGEFLSPWAVAVSPDGSKIAVTDSGNDRIQIFDQTGWFLRMATNPCVEWFNRENGNEYGLKGITFDETGEHIYVIDSECCQLIAFSSDLKTKRCVRLSPKNMLKNPQGVVVDRVGNILISDMGAHCVHMITKDGTLISRKNGIGQDVEDGPRGICILKDGGIVVVNMDEDLIVF